MTGMLPPVGLTSPALGSSREPKAAHGPRRPDGVDYQIPRATRRRTPCDIRQLKPAGVLRASPHVLSRRELQLGPHPLPGQRRPRWVSLAQHDLTAIAPELWREPLQGIRCRLAECLDAP